MDNQAEMRELLRTRRARVTPAEAGLIGGGRRRVRLADFLTEDCIKLLGSLAASEAAGDSVNRPTPTS
jgi:hypothetical protein